MVEWKLTATCAVVFPLVMLWLMKFWKKSESVVGVNLPPGPKKLPIIGNMHLISGPPFRIFRDLSQQYGPMMLLKLGEVDTIIVSSSEIAKEMLKDNDLVFADRPKSLGLEIFWYNYTSIAFSPYGGYWRQMRKICITELLSTKSVRSFTSIRKDEVSHLVDSLRVSAGDTVNLTEKLCSLMSSITCRAAFGKVCKDKDSLLKLVAEMVQMGTIASVADVFPSSKIAHALSWGTKLRLMRMRRNLDVIFDGIIREHETNHKGCNGEFGNEDLVDVLLRIKESGEMEFPIEYDNIKAVLLDMFAAGTDTSSSTVDWAMAELLKHPEVMAKAQAEIRGMVKERGNSTNSIIEEEDIKKLNYLRLVIMETLRLHPPTSIIPRLSREQRKISEYTIPAEMKVLVNVWAIQRDPKHWVDSESFKPERFENEASLEITGNDFRYLPFGSGKRICPGIAFARASVALPLAQLLHDFNWKLPHGVDAQALNMIETSNTATSTKRAENLFVVATLHQSSPPGL